MRGRSQESISLDSLLDVMMNVVGFLVVVLAVLQLSVGYGVSQTERSKIQDEIESIRASTAATARADTNLRSRLGDLENEIQSVEQPNRSGDRVNQIADRWREQDQRAAALEQTILREQRAIDAIRDRIDQLESEPVDDQNLEHLPEAAVVEMYRSQGSGPKPKWLEMKVLDVVCFQGRLFVLDDKRLGKELDEAIRLSTGSGAESLTTSSWQKAVKYFSSNDVGDEFVRLHLVGTGAIQYEFREGDMGDNAARLRSGRSQFETQLRNGTTPEMVWVKFSVWEDSFDVYASARSIAEKLGYRVGWIPFAMDQVVTSTGGSSSNNVYGPDTPSGGR